MQYPIIDLITDAYINNGWTGLNLIESRNVFPVSMQSQSRNGITFTVNNGVIHCEGTATALTVISMGSVTIQPGTYFVSGCPEGGSASTYRMYCSWGTNEIGNGTTRTFTSETNVSLSIAIASGITVNFDYKPFITTSENHEFEPYSEQKNDFPNRLKLPLPHYFPHPVIDALQRAAAGTQTADDTEILQHYLTPLGIGGI